MAAKVNSKFVAIMIGALVALAGGAAGIGYFVLFKSAADYARMGETAEAAGDLKAADAAFAKAVAKEQTNVAYMRKWLGVLRQTVPKNEAEFGEKYQHSVQLVKRIANQLGTDVAAHREYFEILLEDLNTSQFSRSYCEYMAQEVTDALRGYSQADGTYGPGEVLRRYRGLANHRIFVETATNDQEFEKGLVDDLHAALKADPTDGSAAVALESIFLAKAERVFNQSGDKAQAIAVRDQGRNEMTQFAMANPGDARPALSRTQWELADVRMAAADVSDQAQRMVLFTDMQKRAMGHLDEAAAKLLASDLTKLKPATLAQMYGLETTLDSTGKLERTEKVARATLERMPGDPSMLLILADALATRGDYEQAVATLQKIVDLKELPVSLEGRRLPGRKSDAVFRQASLALKQVDMETDAAKRTQYLEQAKTYRQRLAGMVPEGAPALLLTDGRIRLAEQNAVEAMRLLDAYLATPGGDRNADALMAAGRAALGLNQTGRAKERFTRLVQIQPTNVAATVMLADTVRATGDTAAAEGLLQQAARLLPDNKVIQDKLRDVQVAQNTLPSDADPVLRLTAASMALAREGKDVEAAKLIEQNLTALNNDPRLIMALAERRFALGDRGGALAAVEMGLRAHPEVKQLQTAKLVLSEPDETEARLKLIELAEASDLDKTVARYQVLLSAGLLERADAEVDKATKLGPDDKQVLEMAFSKAFRAKQVDVARTLGERAMAQNADGVNGATYRARVLLLEQKPAEAIATLEQASRSGTFTPEAWRMLAQIQMDSGRAADATTAFAEALKLRPNDMQTLLSSIGALAQVGRMDDALKLARANRAFGEQSARFRDVWLSLESTAAEGNREEALTQRMRDLQREPNNRTYKLQVAALLTDLKRFPDARKLINEVRAEKDGLDGVSLDASWHAGQGDLAAATKVFRDYIAGLGTNNKDVQPYFALADFLISRNDVTGGLKVLEEARPLQDPKTMDADRMIGDTLFQRGRPDLSIDAYRRIVDGKADTPEQAYRKRMAEALINAGKFADAEKELTGIEADLKASGSGRKDPIIVLMRAEAARLRGDRKAAGELLDQTVQAFPQEATGYLKRAQLLMEDTASLRDAAADLDQALKLDPGFWQALRVRADVHFRLAKLADATDAERQTARLAALADLQTALKLNPQQDDLLAVAMRNLMSQGRSDEAVALADEVVRRRPEDAGLMVAVGDVLDNAQQPAAALRFYERAFQIDQTTPVTVRYFAALMKGEPRLAQAEQVLSKVRDRIAGDPALLMARAQLLTKRNLNVEARRDVLAALQALKDTQVGGLMAWYQQVSEVLGKPNVPGILDAARANNVKPAWLDYFRARLAFDEATTRDAGIKALRDLAAAPRSDDEAGKVFKEFLDAELATWLYTAGDFNGAAAVMKSVLERNPNDAVMLNNLAFTLAKHVKQPAEALVMAQRAVENGPNSADARDTLGMIQMLNGDLAGADASLLRALGGAVTAGTRSVVLIHLAELRSLQAAKAEGKAKEELLTQARDYLKQVDEIILQEPAAVQEETRADLDRVRGLVR